MTTARIAWVGIFAGAGAAVAWLVIVRRRRIERVENRRAIPWGLADDIAHAVSNAMPHEPGAWSEPPGRAEH
jgi:hypothetical protein